MLPGQEPKTEDVKARNIRGVPADVEADLAQRRATKRRDGAVEPLQPGERSVVLSKLADHLRAAGEVGDGQLFRLLRELVRQYFRPPTVSPEPVHYRRNVGEALE